MTNLEDDLRFFFNLPFAAVAEGSAALTRQWPCIKPYFLVPASIVALAVLVPLAWIALDLFPHGVSWDRAYDPRPLLSRCWRRLKPWLGWLVLATVGVVLAALVITARWVLVLGLLILLATAVFLGAMARKRGGRWTM